jgi:hypothetical protein
MAVLALAAAGAALAPAGYAAIGWTIGTVVGQLLFPGSLPDQVGPRVGDLRAQQSQYGVAIPILYGTTRVAGNVIWSTDLIETVNTTEVGGKGAPSQTQTTYSYRVSMAVMLGEGEVLGVRKIWADGKLIYNVSADADLGTVAASNLLAPGLTFYPGSETQDPDPTMEAYLGAGQVPAYRGRAYLVFSDLQLEAYGNRRPNISCEVVAQGTLSDDILFGTAPATSVYEGIATDGTIWCGLGRAGPAGVTRSSDGVNWSTFIEVEASPPALTCIGYGAGLWVIGTGTTRVYTSPDSITWTSRTIPASGVDFIAHNGLMWVAGRSGTTQMIYSVDGEVWVESAFPSASLWQDVAWNGSVWVAIAQGGQLAVSSDGVLWTAGAVGFGAVWSRIASNGTRFVAVQNGSAGAGYSADGLSWTSTTLAASQYLGLAWTGDIWLAVGNANTAARSLDNGATWIVTTIGGPVGNAARGIAVANGIAVAGPVTGSPGAFSVFRFDIITPGAVTLSSIVSDLCLRAGLEAGDIDVTALTATVDGYAVGQQIAARSAIEPLQRAFFFDAIESDAKIVFRPRGGASVATIAADDLAAASAGDALPDDLSMTRQQEPELPAVVSVVYIDKDADYQQNTQQAQRITTLSTQQTGVELAIAMTADRARAIAETLMYDAWTQRQRYSFRTSREYAAVEPGDVVTIVRNGTTHTLRMQRKVESRSGVIEWEAVAEEASVYTQSAPGGAGSVVNGTVRAAPATVFVPLDIASLRDQDDDLAFYAAACGSAEGWRGSVIYRSTDSGASYDQSVAMTAEATIGYTVNALANYTGSPHMFDQSTLLTVSLFAGTLSSATEEAVLNGANFLAVGFEILQFKSAVLISPLTYQLSGLLRGRRGTEWAIGSHVVGERAVLLEASTLRRITSDLTTARLYKPVTIGRTVQETAPQSIQYFGGNLAPFAPVHLGGGRNAANDLTINWLRRSRVGANLPWNYDPPLGETSQLYDVEIWNTAFATLRRTFSSVSTPTVTYTAAQQSGDSGGLQSSYGVRVFQRGAITGRGYVLQGIL